MSTKHTKLLLGPSGWSVHVFRDMRDRGLHVEVELGRWFDRRWKVWPW